MEIMDIWSKTCKRKKIMVLEINEAHLKVYAYILCYQSMKDPLDPGDMMS